MGEHGFEPASPFSDFFGDPATASAVPTPAPAPGANPVDSSRPPGHPVGEIPGVDPGTSEFLLDPEGYTDRIIMGARLADRFDVVEDGYDGERLPNTVTASEYQEIVKTYSDINLGRSDIKIDRGLTDNNYAYDMSEQEYKEAAMDDIADIMQTQSGRDLVGSLHDNRQVDASGNQVHRQTHIQARTDSSGQWPDDTGADTGQLEGGDSIIFINPNRDVDDGEIGRTRSDVALYHEMVHAHHDTHGTTRAGNVEASDLPGDYAVETDAAFDRPVERAEHQAMGIGEFKHAYLSENNYRSERFGVAASGRGIGGDLSLQDRVAYSDRADDYDAFDGTTEIPK